MKNNLIRIVHVIGNVIELMDKSIAATVFQLLKEQHVNNVECMLDVGCNNGDTSAKIAQVVGSKMIFGVDIDYDAIQDAQRKSITAFRVDLDEERLPFSDGQFDFVVMTEVLEHLVNVDDALQQVLRVLSSNGKFLLTTPNLSWYVNRLILLFGYQPYWTGCGKYNVGKFKRSVHESSSAHLRLYTARALVDLLELNGFEIVTLKGSSIGQLPGMLGSMDRAIARLRWSLAQDIVVLAKK